MRELFIYYRSAATHAAEVQDRVIAFQAALTRRFPGLQARLLRRPEVDERGLHTWMETYSMDPLHRPDGLDAEHERAIADAALALGPLLVGLRHTERFVSCAS